MNDNADMNDLDRLGLAVTLPELGDCAEWLKAGTRDVELQDISEPHVMDGDWRTNARRSAELLEGHRGRVGVHAPFWNIPVAAIDTEIRRVVQARLNQGLDYLEELGAAGLVSATGETHMVIHSPFHFFGHPLVAHQDSLQAEIEVAHLTLAPLLSRAERLGCTLVIENILDINPAPLLALVESFSSPHVRLSIDVGHAHLMTGRGGPPAAQWLSQGAALLGHVHLQDNDGTADAHLAPGGGTVHWASILRELRRSGTDPRLIVEVMPGELGRAMAWIDALEQG